MSKHTAHSPAPQSIGILDLSHTLLHNGLLSEIGASIYTPPLQHLLIADRLAELYTLVFPEKPDWLAETDVDWRDESDIATAVDLFMSRVNTLFPVQLDIWELEMEFIRWRLYQIPITPLGFDCFDAVWEDFQEPIPYLFHLHHSRDDDTFANLYPNHLLPLTIEPHHLIDALNALIAEGVVSELALHGLPTLIAMMESATGNDWLDMSELFLMETDGYPPWSAEAVAYLTAEWLAAEPLYDAVLALLRWSAEEDDRKLTAVRQLLLTAYERSLTDE